ncbi:MAG TPA: hypothetical protein VHQ23_00950 [Ilumatobacteraceae bacterium]|nr:hypothetical protein [Ilumatobacteraceae bacterium]
MSRFVAKPAIVAASAWTSIYIVLWATGQRFSTQYLDIAWQLIPVEVLRSDPIGSVWHLHIQPPLWNLLIGGVLAWSPLPDAISLQIIQFAFGVASVALLASLLARLFARPIVGIVIATVVMLDPQVLANAFTPTYELATTCGLIAVLWLVVVQPRSPGFTLVSIAAVGTAVVLTRTVFHPAWLVALLLVSWWVVRRSIDARTIVLTVAMPLVLVGGWMVKNEVMFDRPTLSSWFGMNLQRAVVPIATDDQLDTWAAEGHISEITASYPSGFVSYSAYEPYIGECIPKGDHPATNNLTREGQLAVPNFNADCYLPVYDIAEDDAKWVIANHPSLYLEGRWWATRAWVMESPPPLLPTSPIYDAMRPMYRVAQLGLPLSMPSIRIGDLPWGAVDVPAHLSLLQALATLLVIGAGARAALRRLRRLPSSRWIQVEIVAALIVGWNFAVGVLFELGEQSRFRAVTDPITMSIACWLVWRMVDHVRRQRSAKPELVAG